MLEASREVTGKEPLVCGSCLSYLSVITKYGSSKAYGFGAGETLASRVVHISRMNISNVKNSWSIPK